MLTLEQRIGRRIPVVLIVLWCLTAITLLVSMFRYSEVGVNTILTILVLAFTIYYGHKNLFSSTRDYGYQVMFNGMVSASENARLFNIDDGFFAEESDDDECCVMVAWKTAYKRDSNGDILDTPYNRHYVFCMFFRVVSNSENYKSAMPPEFKDEEFSSHPWWDYSAKISYINGQYRGRIVGNCNTERKNMIQVNNMTDSDFVYARQVIGKIHTFDYDKMKECGRDGIKYGVSNLNVNEPV